MECDSEVNSGSGIPCEERQSRFRLRLILNLGLLLVLLGTALYCELPSERQLDNKCELVDRTDVKGSAEYSQVVTSGFRSIRSRRVTIIPLGVNDPAAILNNVCEQRFYLARLVRRLAALGAAVIVIDKYFGARSCNQSDQGTADLIRTIQESSAPVIVGMATHSPPSDPQNACLILSGSLDFGNKQDAQRRATDTPAVLFGLTRLNSDLRRIPINWFTYRNDEEFRSHAQPTTDNVETLSYVAASVVDKRLKDEDRLQKLRDRGEHPFTSFISPDSISQASAFGVLCAGSDRQEVELRYSMKCVDTGDGDDNFRGQVVVIGQESAGDIHTLLGERVTGLYLQANYIESLLDGRYLRPLGTSWNIGVFIGWLALSYVLFWAQPEMALGACFLIWYLMRYAIAQVAWTKGLYIDLWVQEVGMAAILLKYIESRGHRIAERIRARNRGRHKGLERQRE